MKFKSNFKVTVPATIANLACGFDALGLALDNPQDEIIVKPSDQPGIQIGSIINNKAKLSLDPHKNAAGISGQLVLDFLKKEHGLDKKCGLNLHLNKKIGVGYGLGSSGASAVAGAFAVNEAFGAPLNKRELLPFIVPGEQEAEQQFRINSILPSLLGGIILTRDHSSYDFHRLPLIRGLHAVVIYPRNYIFTQQGSRKKLPQKISTQDAIQQAANMGALIQAFYTTNLDLLSRSLTDLIGEKYYSDRIPCFHELKEAGLGNKALGVSIAGLGSGVFALCKNSLEAENVAEAMKEVYETKKIRHNIIISQINQEGAIIA